MTPVGGRHYGSRKINRDNTYCRWKRRYQGMDTFDVKRLKTLEKENARLKKLVADLSLQNDILKEVNEGNF